MNSFNISIFYLYPPLFLLLSCLYPLPQIPHPTIQISQTHIHCSRLFRHRYGLIPNLLQEIAGVLQLLLEIDSASDDPHLLCYGWDYLYGLLF